MRCCWLEDPQEKQFSVLAILFPTLDFEYLAYVFLEKRYENYHFLFMNHGIGIVPHLICLDFSDIIIMLVC